MSTLPKFELSATANVLIVLTLVALIAQNLPVLVVFEEAARYAHLHLILESVAIGMMLITAFFCFKHKGSSHSNHAIFLGALISAVLVIDIAHTLSYKGMPNFFGPSHPEKAINLWLIARALTACGLVWIGLKNPTPLAKGTAVRWLVAGLAAGLVLSLIALTLRQYFPRTFIEGQGLTLFKVNTEIAIALACATASWLLYRRGPPPAHTQTIDYRFLAAAAWIFALTDSFFASYKEVTDVFNMLGHIYKIIGVAMLLLAVWPNPVRTSSAAP